MGASVRHVVLFSSVLAVLCAALSDPTTATPMFMGLGSLPQGFGCNVLGLSGDGRVAVGHCFIPGGSEAFRWEDGVMTGLGDLPGGIFDSSGRGADHDGSVIVGIAHPASDGQAFRWEGGSMISLATSLGNPVASGALAVSGDGSVIVGGILGTAFRLENGIVTSLGFEGATDVSADGSIVVGRGFGYEAVRWQSGAVIGLGDLPGGTFKSEARGVSADGSVVVGYGNSNSGEEAFRWENGVMSGLGFLPGSQRSDAFGVSGDGAVAVGESGVHAFIWDETSGMRQLSDVLTNGYGLDLTGWSLHRATAISDDGRTIVGIATHNGQGEAWIAVLPEPSPMGLLVLAVVSLALTRIRRRRTALDVAPGRTIAGRPDS